MTIRGLLHCHSTYSDGDFSLAELRAVLLADGCRFVAMADHAEWFDAARLAQFAEECAALSDERFLFVPGLEYECDPRIHVLGFGMTRPIASRDASTVIRAIRDAGGIAVVAHPPDEWFESLRSLEALPHGLEVWNTKSDGRYGPRPGTFELLAELRARTAELHGFYGVDLHWRRQYRGLQTVLHGASPEPAAILGALGRGAFIGATHRLRLPSDGALSSGMLDRFSRRQQRSRLWRRFTGRVHQATVRAGLTLPAPLKAHLRRLF